MAVILASQSPRRRELLTKLGLRFCVVTADVDETMQQGKDPCGEVARVCRAKALAVRDRGHDKDLIIAADTIVVVQGEVLGKPKDREDAARMLRLLSGRDHEVMTGLTVLQAERSRTLVETARIHFRQLDEQEIAAYIATGEPMDKAGDPIWNTEEMIKAGWMDESGKWKTHNHHRPTCMDKAGAYGIQGLASIFITGITGDYYTVMGLPVCRLAETLKDFGIRILPDAAE